MVTLSIINPTVHMLGDNAACIAYTRFAQYLDKSVYISAYFISSHLFTHKQHRVSEKMLLIAI